MRNNKLLIIILMCIIVGFATVSVTLFINNAIIIGSDNSNFDIYFSEAILDGVDKSNILITEDRKHITFETKILKNPGDSSKLDFEVTNNSTLYDAKVIVSCYSNNEEKTNNGLYLIETDKSEYNIPAQTRQKGGVTVKLLKAYAGSEMLEEDFTCELIVNAEERTTIAQPNIKDDTYQITGTLKDSNGNILPEQNVVVFSDTPHYIVTDDFGYFYVNGLEKGEHEIYVVNSDLTGKSKAEIKEAAIDQATVTTSSKSIKFKKVNLNSFVVEPEKSGKVDINLDPEDGSVSSNKITVDLYSKGNEFPTPKWTGYTFKYWKYQGKEVTNKTIINDTKDLKPEWEANEYTITINSTNTTVKNAKDNDVSNSSIIIKYDDGTANVTITPASNYYISEVSCTNGYTTNANVGRDYYNAQTIRISNNKQASDTICTIKSSSRNYDAVLSTVAATATKHTHSTSKCSYKTVNGVSGIQEKRSTDNVNTKYCNVCKKNVGVLTIAYVGKCSVCGASINVSRSRCAQSDHYNFSDSTGSLSTHQNHISYTCTKTYDYSCSSGTLSGTTCSVYTCPDGGTLSGTTCVF